MRTILITGANSGLGFACTRAILARDQDVIVVMACRDLNRGEAALRTLREAAQPRAKVVELNLADVESIASLPNRLADLGVVAIDCLIENAGLGFDEAPPRTRDG
jgi:NAD(P)-dependent dehydrogenase (short-subunit alcohol dehydrogenase family)